jgi:hypothetical protein
MRIKRVIDKQEKRRAKGARGCAAAYHFRRRVYPDSGLAYATLAASEAQGSKA